MKICLVGAELLHPDGRTDGQADMTKLMVAFRIFPNAPENQRLKYRIFGCFQLSFASMILKT
jgi:hypothetical protein